MHLLLRREIIRVVFHIYTAGILLLLILPINGDDQLLGQLNHNYVLEIRFDYISHVLLFIPWVLMGGAGWEIYRKSLSTIGFSLLVALSFSVLCEYLQFWLPYRTFNINDLASNGLGTILGYVLMWVRIKYTE